MTRIAPALMAVAIAFLTVHVPFVSFDLVHGNTATQYEQLPRKGFLGVRLALLSDEVRARLHLQSGSGVLIEAVIPGTTAADEGLRHGDVLLVVNGKTITVSET